MGEGNVFSFSVHISSGEGDPIWLTKRVGGKEDTPTQVWMGRGVPHPRSRRGGGYPIAGLDGGGISGLDRGVSHPAYGGVPPSQVWIGAYSILLMGGTPIQDQDREVPRGSPHQDWMGVPPLETGWGTFVRKCFGSVMSGMGRTTPETLAVYSGFFFDDVVLLLDVSS